MKTKAKLREELDVVTRLLDDARARNVELHGELQDVKNQDMKNESAEKVHLNGLLYPYYRSGSPAEIFDDGPTEACIAAPDAVLDAVSDAIHLESPLRWVVMCTTHSLPLGDVEAWTVDEAVQKYLKVKAVCELVNSGAAPQFYVKTWNETAGQANVRIEPAQEMKIFKR